MWSKRIGRKKRNRKEYFSNKFNKRFQYDGSFSIVKWWVKRTKMKNCIWQISLDPKYPDRIGEKLNFSHNTHHVKQSTIFNCSIEQIWHWLVCEMSFVCNMKWVFYIFDTQFIQVAYSWIKINVVITKSTISAIFSTFIFSILAILLEVISFLPYHWIQLVRRTSNMTAKIIILYIH